MKIVFSPTIKGGGETLQPLVAVVAEAALAKKIAADLVTIVRLTSLFP